MIKFNSDNLIVGEIKQLLKNFNLPACKVFVPGMFVVQGEYYIRYPYLYRAKETCFTSKLTEDKFEVVELYSFGQKIKGLTKTYALDSLIYDTHLHRYLGEYLRFYSDFYNINLMSMYNCFSNEIADNISFGKVDDFVIDDVLYEQSGEAGPKYLTRVDWESTESGPISSESGDIRYVQVRTSNVKINHDKATNATAKIYAVPIKLFKEYTIGIDCDTPIELMLDFYNRNFEITVINNDVMRKLHEWSYKIERDCRFNKPFLFTRALFDDGTFSKDILEEFMKQEDSFRLLIKIPSQNNSSISVVEGNYLKNCDRVFNDKNQLNLGNVPVISNSTPKELYSYITKMELFKINSCVQHPFANRLAEYLTDNVISNEDTIEKNVERVQLSLYHPKLIDGTYTRRLPLIKFKGIWNDEIKETIFRDALRENSEHKYDDLLYFVDKDIEADIIKEASEYGNE